MLVAIELYMCDVRSVVNSLAGGHMTFARQSMQAVNEMSALTNCIGNSNWSHFQIQSQRAHSASSSTTQMAMV